ncbi:MAG: DUF2244 domain-containing protein [Pseudomonadota bacterium]
MEERSEIVYMDAVLTPNRSLSPTAFVLIMLAIAILSFIAGIAFLAMGAFPVIGFFGLDALAIWVAFRASFRSQRQETRIRITAEALDLYHIQPGRPDRHETLPTAFARVDLQREGNQPSELHVSHAGRTFVIGRFLAPDERVDLAKALKNAVLRARSERYQSSG